MTDVTSRRLRRGPGDASSPSAADPERFRRIHEAAWPDMFANLQAAYAELTETRRELERQKAEIERGRDLFERVLASMSEALFLVDHGGKILRANRAAAELLGREDGEVVGRPLAACFEEPVPVTAWEVLQRSPRGVITDLDLHALTVEGRRIPVSLSASVVRDDQGRITGVLAVARDVTAQKQAERALERQARELARSNAELEQFAYVASHDLQEPIRMMASFADLLTKRYGGRLDEEADEFLEFIVDGATRMRRLVNDLLAYSRVGRQGEPQVVDCREVAEKACENLRSAIEDAGAEIRLGDPLPIVRGIETGLTRVFQNLIGNALKFRQPDRPVRIEVGARKEAGEWVLHVRDNGIGIEAERAGRLFQIFQRLHTRQEYPGTGIGLAICKKILEQHGGRIWVESAPEEGSTFYFTLPVDAPDSAEQSGGGD